MRGGKAGGSTSEGEPQWPTSIYIDIAMDRLRSDKELSWWWLAVGEWGRSEEEQCKSCPNSFPIRRDVSAGLKLPIAVRRSWRG